MKTKRQSNEPISLVLETENAFFITYRYKIHVQKWLMLLSKHWLHRRYLKNHEHNQEKHRTHIMFFFARERFFCIIGDAVWIVFLLRGRSKHRFWEDTISCCIREETQKQISHWLTLCVYSRWTRVWSTSQLCTYVQGNKMYCGIQFSLRRIISSP